MNKFGFDLAAVVAGISGAICSIVVFKTGSWGDRIATLIVGALVANYVGQYAAKMTGMPDALAGFACGLVGLYIVQMFSDYVRSRLEKEMPHGH